MISREELFSIIDKDQLPCQYGGTCRCKMDPLLFDEQGGVIRMFFLLHFRWNMIKMVY